MTADKKRDEWFDNVCVAAMIDSQSDQSDGSRDVAAGELRVTRRLVSPLTSIWIKRRKRSEQEQARAPLDGFYVAKKVKLCGIKRRKKFWSLFQRQPSNKTSFIISTWQLVILPNINLCHKLITRVKAESRIYWCLNSFLPHCCACYYMYYQFTAPVWLLWLPHSVIDGRLHVRDNEFRHNLYTHKWIKSTSSQQNIPLY